ncbi:MAG: nitrophenyl compound nitroreductase subunit ArsF family protein [Candidatus Nanoarchaeia archaeon]|jgi:hypothetical protein
MKKSLLLIGLLLISGCASTGDSIINQGGVNRLEVIHFHGNNQCVTCRSVGAYAQITLNDYFSDELSSGLITFKSVNFELPENNAIAAQYKVAGSSLFIGVYFDDGSFRAVQDTRVWYKVNNLTDYADYFKGVISNCLIGDFS